MKTNEIKLWLLVVLAFTTNVFCTFAQQGAWTKKTDFGGVARWGAVGFSIGNKAYVLTGQSYYDDYKTDLWEYDSNTNIWTKKAYFKGDIRDCAVGFSIGTKGYIGTGSSTKDFWEYDQVSDIWTRKADFGGTARKGAVGFSIGTKGYIGTGSSFTNDFWEYDPINNSWKQKANFKGTARWYAVGFSIGTKGYIGTGYDYYGKNSKRDFWEYDQTSDIWTQKADFGGTERFSAVGFSIGSKGYIGTGNTRIMDYYTGTYTSNDFWEYDPSSNIWVQQTNLGGINRDGAVGFSIGTKGYIGIGSSRIKDFWEYNPGFPCINIQPLTQTKCIGDKVLFTIHAINGDLTYQWKHNDIDIIGATKDTLILTNINLKDSGNYTCVVLNSYGKLISNAGVLTVNQILPVSVKISTAPSGAICLGTFVSFTAIPSNGGNAPKYQWKVNGLDFDNNPSFGYTPYIGDSVSCTITSNSTCILGDGTASTTLRMLVDTNVVRINISKNPLGFVCKGANVSFKATSIKNGGTNPSYQWKVNRLNVGTNNPEFNSSTLSNGDSVICELTSNAFCVSNNISSSNPLVATIHSFPTAHKSYVEISKCSNCSVELDALEGATYFWSPAEGLSATNIKNPIANPITSTTYTVQITDSNGCTCTDTTIVLVKPSFSIEAINDTTIQKGQSLILGIKPILYNVKIFFTFYDGFNPEHFIIRNSKTEKIVFWISQNENNYFFYGKGGNFESIAKIESGDYYIDELRAWSYSVTPSVGTHLNNNTFTVGGTDYTYSWMPETYLDNASIANPTATPLTDTKYIVTVNTNTGCIAKDTLNVKVINSTGLNIQKATNDYVIYPNPITESFQINGIDEVVTIKLTDVSGRIMLSKQVFGNEQIFVSSLPKGLYIVKIYTNKGGIERKLVKK